DSRCQRGIGRHPLRQLMPDPGARLAPSRGEDLVEQLGPANRADSLEQARGQAVVVRWEQLLRIGCDVVDVARSAHPMAHGLASNEVRGLEGPELLQYPGAARG